LSWGCSQGPQCGRQRRRSSTDFGGSCRPRVATLNARAVLPRLPPSRGRRGWLGSHGSGAWARLPASHSMGCRGMDVVYPGAGSRRDVVDIPIKRRRGYARRKARTGPPCPKCERPMLASPCTRSRCRGWSVLCWACPDEDEVERFIETDGRCPLCRTQ
jgi:hypothetical protein